MDHEFHSIVEKLAILEGRISPEGKPVTPLKQEKPALFSFVKPVVEAVAVSEEKVSEETSDDILSKVKNSLVDYLKNAEDSIKQDHELIKKKKQDLDLKKKELKDLDLQHKKQKEEQEEQIDEDHQKLEVGDEVCVTGPNEYEGEFGEVSEFAPSGKFVVIKLRNGDEVSMHISDVEFHNDQEDFDDEELDEGDPEYYEVVYIDDKGRENETTRKFTDKSKAEDHAKKGNAIDKVGGKYVVRKVAAVIDEDPAQEDPGAVAPITSINPTYEATELPFVESFMLDEVTECSINGDADHGYEIRRGDRALPTRFNDVEHARMAAQLFKNRLAKQKDQDDSADYIDEK